METKKLLECYFLLQENSKETSMKGNLKAVNMMAKEYTFGRIFGVDTKGSIGMMQCLEKVFTILLMDVGEREIL